MTKVIGIRGRCNTCEYEVTVKNVHTEEPDYIVVSVEPCQRCIKAAQQQVLGQARELLDDAVYFEDGTGGLVR